MKEEVASNLEHRDPRYRFAAECRSARELYPERSLSQTELARMVRVSKSTISRVETCTGPIPPDLPPQLDRVFATDGLFKRLYEEIVKQSFPSQYRLRLEVEANAVAIVEWSPTVVPGLLQTASYARALFKAGTPNASNAELAQKVRARLARQEVLRGTSPPDFSVVVCESVVRRNVGGPSVMRDQLAALLAYGAQPANILQVLPLSAATHGLMDSSASILTTSEARVHQLVGT
ncbi:Scr1 family TA system antitoxin-like transcriptional regulator [Streptomyces sp. NPDC090442]|uniref:helix-turn-helix domain-containing protein n=1 Tax=Streptomyces sp. NPDC090442 TaxID=3365962 RepID=UPI0037F4112A